MRYLFLTILMLISVSAGAIERDPNSSWIKEWNSPYLSIFERQEIAKRMEANDYLRYGREIVGIIDKNASTTPPAPIEREIVYFTIALHHMNEWQQALYSVWAHSASQPAGYAEKVLKDVPKARELANVYMRKLMELPNLTIASQFLIARIQELNGDKYSSAIKVERGALLWEFAFVKNSVRGYLLNDFREDYKRIPVEKRGGGTATLLRTICAGMLFCYAGMRYDNELVVNELNNQIRVFFVYDGRTVGEYNGRELPYGN